MNFGMLLSKLGEIISSQSAAMGEGLIIIGLVIFIIIVAHSRVQTSTNTCLCFKDGHETIMTENGNYFKCKACGGLFEFERGIPVKKILRFFFKG